MGVQGRRSRRKGSYSPKEDDLLRKATLAHLCKLYPNESSQRKKGSDDHPHHGNFRSVKKCKFLTNCPNVRNINTRPDLWKTEKCLNWKQTALLSKLKRTAHTTKQTVRCYTTDAKLGKVENCNIQL